MAKSERVISNSSAQDHPLSSVPMSERKNFWSICTILLGWTFFTGTMSAGAEVGLAFDFPNVLLILLNGNLLLGAVVGSLSLISYKTGLSTVLLARYSFGKKGARLVDLILLCVQGGWFAVMIGLFVTILMGLFGWTSPVLKYALMLIWGVLFAWPAYFGAKGMEKLSFWSIPLMCVLIVTSMAIATRDIGGFSGLFTQQPSASMTMGAAITMIFGTFIGGGVQVTNVTRYAKNAKTAFIASLLAFFIGNAFMMLGGAYSGIVYGLGDLVEVMKVQGIVIAGALLLLLNIWTTQDACMYALSIAGCALVHTEKRQTWVIIGGAVGIVIAMMGIYNHFFGWLDLLGTFIPPIAGIVISDYWFRFKQNVPALSEKVFSSINFAGIITYVLSCGIAYFTPGLPPVNGIVSAIVLYAILSKIPALIGPMNESFKE